MLHDPPLNKQSTTQVHYIEKYPRFISGLRKDRLHTQECFHQKLPEQKEPLHHKAKRKSQQINQNKPIS